MREVGRGGSLVAATIAALHNRSTPDVKSRSVNTRSTIEEARNVSQTIREDHVEDFYPRRVSAVSDRPLSTASEASERDSASVQSSEDPPRHESGDSDSADETTVKCSPWKDRAGIPPRADSSDSDSSTTEDDSDEHEYETGVGHADFPTLTPNRRVDNTTRCDNDFKWMPSGDMNCTGEAPLMSSRVEDYASNASLDRRRRRSSDRSDRDRKTRSSLPGKPPQHPSSVRVSPRSGRISRNEETPPDLQRRWNSYEHFRWPEGGWWPPVCWCHGPPAPPPCYLHERTWPSHPSLPVPSRTYKNDAEDRVRRLEADKESLQLQVQVLSEQIAAQTEKMSDLERSLHDTRQRLDDTEQRLQKEMLQRSSLETQKLELLSKLSEVRLRVAERGLAERSPPPEPAPLARPAPPRTPPANYGRQIERNTHMYSSLPRACVPPADGRALAEKEDVPRGSPSPSLREVRARRVRLEGDERASVRRTRPPAATDASNAIPAPWETTDIREWDCDMTCGWLESIGLEAYVPAARAWLSDAQVPSSPSAQVPPPPPGNTRGRLANASSATIEKELALKHPMHKKKIMLAITDLMGGDGDPLLSLAGSLDGAWTLRWLEDIGAGSVRGAAADAALDGRTLHRLTHTDLHHSLRVHHALHALAIRRGIQVLRENNFDPDTMIRRAAEAPGVEGPGAEGPEGEVPEGTPPEGDGRPAPHVARWSAHRVMQWLNEIDLAEYAPNLRGAGVHGGLLVLEARFTAELLAALLHIPANKTLLRRHLTQRFNDLLGRDVIQQKRNAEQTLGYQPLTATTKYKVPKKNQFSLKRKKSKDELADLVCPLRDSDDESRAGGGRRVGCLSPA